MRERLSTPAGNGVIAIFTVLLVLILAVFSVLTLATARGDLALARRGAETVRAYYEADGLAWRQLAAFARGEEAVFETLVPMSEAQGLYVHALRQPGGGMEVLVWRTVLLDDPSDGTERKLNVWTGEQ